jgi:hypothetical protein
MDELMVALTGWLDEDERAARDMQTACGPEFFFSAPDPIEAFLFRGPEGAFDLPDRILREVEAKRRILKRHPGSTAEDECPGCGANLDGTWRTGPSELCPEQIDIAQPYSGRDGWRDEWAL